MLSLRAVLVLAILTAACGPSKGGGGDDDGGTGTPDAGPVCTPDETRACYDGPAGTEGVGPCTGGTQTCNSSGQWSACQGQVVPSAEVCANTIDDNCSGEVDEDVDLDADGYSSCAGDCCDSTADGCTEPQLVNPGAFEVDGNQLDDDCDGTADNALAACDDGLASNSSTAMDYARAIGLCQVATDGTWGVVSATLTRASGSGAPAAASRSIRPAFGGTALREGMAMAVFSSGNAADANDTNPAYAAFQIGADKGTTSAFPADWLAANGGNLPSAPGCPDVLGNDAFDSVMLTLTIKAPSNARSFSLNADFFSAEYPEWVCSPYNDFLVILLDSTYAGDPPNPTDKNLATYTAPSNAVYPVGVNLAFGDTGLFRQCKNGPTGCTDEATDGNQTTCTGVTGLAGTGFDVANPPAPLLIEGWCGSSNLAGGGTGWLETRGNVVGGETITLRIAIWDTSDPIYDSLVLVDNFQWSVDAAEPGTVID